MQIAHCGINECCLLLPSSTLTPLRPPGKEVQRPVAHECLGEVLRVLRQVISTYPLLNTVEILTAAGKLISRVKGVYHSQQEAALPCVWKPPPQYLTAV